MMSQLTNLNAIAAVQNVEQKQISDSTGTVITQNSTYKKDVASSNASDNKVLSKETKDDFKNLLNQLKNNKNETPKNNKTKLPKGNDAREVRDKSQTVKKSSKDKAGLKFDDIEDLEEKIENLTDEQLLQCMNVFVEFLNQSLNNNELNSNSLMMNQDSTMDSLSEELKTSLMELFNSTNVADAINNETVRSSNLFDKSQNVFNDLLTLLTKADASEKIDVDTLKFAQKLLSEVSEKLNNDTSMSNSSNSSTLLNILDQTTNKINELLNSSKNDNELSLQNNSLNNVYKVISESTNNDTKDSSNSESYSSSQSKDEKVLQSILGDKSAETSMPVFTTTTTIVNNSTGAVVESTQTVNIKTMAEDVVRNVKYMASNDMREMVVKVNPGNLGEITIRLIEEDGAMKLHMKAVSKETYSLLVQQSSDIKNQLSDQNIKIHDVNISLYEEDTTFFKDGEFSNSFSEQKGSKGNKQSSTAHNDLEDNEDSKDNNYDDSAVDMLV